MRLMVMNGLLGPAKSGEFTPLDINLDDRGRRNGCSLHERVYTSHGSLKTQRMRLSRLRGGVDGVRPQEQLRRAVTIRHYFISNDEMTKVVQPSRCSHSLGKPGKGLKTHYTDGAIGIVVIEDSSHLHRHKPDICADVIKDLTRPQQGRTGSQHVPVPRPPRIKHARVYVQTRRFHGEKSAFAGNNRSRMIR